MLVYPPVIRLNAHITRLKNGPTKTYEKTKRKRMSDIIPVPRTLFSKRERFEDRFQGSAERNTVNPSSGGNGIKLNKPKNRLTKAIVADSDIICLLYTSPSPRD